MSFRQQYGLWGRFVHAAFLLALALLAPQAAAQSPREVRILALGDSLTAGYGLPAGRGFVPQLQAQLRRHGVAATVIDAGVSGDTAAAGQARLGWTLDGLDRPPTLAIVALGGNDMLRGLPPAQARAALDSILTELGRRNIPVVLAGMRAAPNLGPDYIRAFEGMYPALARKHNAALHPFFLEGVAGNRALNLADGIHPNVVGIKRMVSGITPVVLQALER